MQNGSIHAQEQPPISKTIGHKQHCFILMQTYYQFCIFKTFSIETGRIHYFSHLASLAPIY